MSTLAMSNGGQQRKKASSAFHLIAGLGSGATSAFLLQPADLLKTRVQQSQAASLTHALRDILNGPRPIPSLWRGVVPSVMRTGCGSALYFGMLNQMRQYALRMPAVPVVLPTIDATSTACATAAATPAKLSNIANLSTGALARVAAGLIVNPITVLKVRYESTHYSYTSLLSAAKDSFTKEGPRGFFAGFGATAVRDAPYAGLYVLLYEQSKTRLAAVLPSSSSSLLGTNMTTSGTGSASTSASVNFLSGVIAAVSATTLTNPFDAIKTRLQIAPSKYGNMVRAARMMLEREGVQSMFSGLSMRIGRKAVSSAFTWTVYEELVKRAERVVG